MSWLPAQGHAPFNSRVEEAEPHVDSIPGLRKIQDLIIYQDSSFHSAFPSIIKRKNGDFIVAF